MQYTLRTIFLAVCFFGLLSKSNADGPVRFNRDIRPILSENCFECHGPDQKQRRGDLRLDLEKGLTDDRGGYRVLVPGDPKKSELVDRLLATDGRHMPPKKTKKHLTKEQIALVQRWIEEGAKYEKHWSLITPKSPELPKVKNAEWVRNPIDRFVLSRLEAKGIVPTPEADRATLIRRWKLTLLGLPPTPEEIDTFVKDKSAQPEKQLFDRLFRSPHYGERMAWFWLDAARYADTDGYQIDSTRTMWPWRDWVIKAFNDNMPFDRFTIEQLAGDMLPEPTPTQVLATAFNRNHRLNGEGGALPEEFIVEYVIDRVETTSTVWLGLTFGCARCHDHKYDPISQKEFYRFYGYFNNVPERGTGKGTNAPPARKFSSPLAKTSAKFAKLLEEKRGILIQLDATLDQRIAKWEQGPGKELIAKKNVWTPADVVAVKSLKGGKLTEEADGSYRNSGRNIANEEYLITLRTGKQQITGLRLDAIRDNTFTAPLRFARSVNGNFVLTTATFSKSEGDGRTTPVVANQAVATFEQTGFPIKGVLDTNSQTGWAVYGHPGGKNSASTLFSFKEPIQGDDKSQITVHLKFESKYANHNIGRFRLWVTEQSNPSLKSIDGISGDLLIALKTAPDKRTNAHRQTIRRYYKSIDPEFVRLQAEIRQLEEQSQKGNPQVNVMVMQEKAGVTPTYLLKRGQYNLPDKSEVLQRLLPVSINPNTKKTPKDRLELARWLVSPDNPLTARVTVNRIWQQHFGVGLVKTAEDFGSQGEWPTYPDLLDWLAVEFMESGWDVQHIHRLILDSATYRQKSIADPKLLRSDPENRLLTRGPRFRLDGATIRDQALYVSGLLNKELGGPPVKPYQPQGLWSTVANSANRKYVPSKGEDLYRRSLYTFWRRTVAPPQLTIFDAAGREVCNVRARVTNTPLQSLVLMNDPTYLEAARALAERMMKRKEKSADEKLAWGYRTVTGKRINDKRLEILRKNLAFFRQHFKSAPDDARKFLSIGNRKRDESLDLADHAAYTSVAHLLLNMDATITLE